MKGIGNSLTDLSDVFTEINDLNTKLDNSWEVIYPVNSIYISTNSTDPSILFGGIWQQLKDRFLLAAGEDWEAGKTGGEAQHTLTINEMPSHEHSMSTKVGAAASGGPLFATGKNWNTSFKSNDGSQYPPIVFNTTGGSQPHNNMPPYLAVYIWERIA